MSERIKIAVVIVAILTALLAGYGFRGATHRCPECPKCPELVSRSHIERDSIILHDTVRVVKYSQSITVRTDPIDTVPNGDDVVSYEVIDTMPDKAVIGFMLSSRELPDRQLPDLVHTAWYLAKPDRIKIISDTLTVRLPALKCPGRFWWDVKIGGVCIGIGAVAATSYFILR
jgi:hypothetical protein